MKIALGSDHGGFEIKETVKDLLNRRGIEVEDHGSYSKESVDYPDYAHKVAVRVSQNIVQQGILVCTSGIGMSMAANKFPRVRAALCLSPHMAEMARKHNNANILVLGGKLVSSDQARDIVDEWLKNSFDAVERHERRVQKIGAYSAQAQDVAAVFDEDPEIYAVIQREIERQQTTINLIASENYTSRAVRQAQGSVFTNKYAEGYPGDRWYSGCEHIDAAERLAISRAKDVFGAEHANVQPHCGSSANMAVYFSALKPGDTILSMRLTHGGHLTHGHKINFSGRLFNVIGYGVNKNTEQIDFDEVVALAEAHKPKLIVAGASSYPRILDFQRFREVADRVGARLMVDMAHIAGLVAGECHPNPVPYAEFVTTTTHKTLRGPRSGMILCRRQFAEEIDRQMFPGIQGGPHVQVIAAAAVCFHEALRPEFKEYARQIVRNAKALAEALRQAGFRLVSGGTDNHIVLVDLSPKNIAGKDAAIALAAAGLTANKNVIPFDTKSPHATSGIRLGTPAVTTRGMKEPEMKTVAELIMEVLADMRDEAALRKVREKVKELTAHFPIE